MEESTPFKLFSIRMSHEGPVIDVRYHRGRTKGGRLRLSRDPDSRTYIASVWEEARVLFATPKEAIEDKIRSHAAEVVRMRDKLEDAEADLEKLRVMLGEQKEAHGVD